MINEDELAKEVGSALDLSGISGSKRLPKANGGEAMVAGPRLHDMLDGMISNMEVKLSFLKKFKETL